MKQTIRDRIAEAHAATGGPATIFYCNSLTKINTSTLISLVYQLRAMDRRGIKIVVEKEGIVPIDTIDPATIDPDAETTICPATIRALIRWLEEIQSLRALRASYSLKRGRPRAMFDVEQARVIYNRTKSLRLTARHFSCSVETMRKRLRGE